MTTAVWVGIRDDRGFDVVGLRGLGQSAVTRPPPSDLAALVPGRVERVLHAVEAAAVLISGPTSVSSSKGVADGQRGVGG